MDHQPSQQPHAVFLIGFMGAGKTSVGRALAERLGWRFLDLDDRIEQRQGRSIAEIFRDQGEAAFRRAESTALQELLEELPNSPDTVAALGGGAFVQEENARRLRATPWPVIFLDASVEELRRRCAVAHASRPLFQEENRFRQLYEERRMRYMAVELRVDTEAKSIDQVVAEVLVRLQTAARANPVPREVR
ncbi:MAG TPA: shikimate kinase [Terriglobales bacterium]|jgi:shikimate kinase|nr:shikimate kinase [Terriglobales bacterium]